MAIATRRPGRPRIGRYTNDHLKDEFAHGHRHTHTFRMVRAGSAATCMAQFLCPSMCMMPSMLPADSVRTRARMMPQRAHTVAAVRWRGRAVGACLIDGTIGSLLVRRKNDGS